MDGKGSQIYDRYCLNLSGFISLSYFLSHFMFFPQHPIHPILPATNSSLVWVCLVYLNASSHLIS